MASMGYGFLQQELPVRYKGSPGRWRGVQNIYQPVERFSERVQNIYPPVERFTRQVQNIYPPVERFSRRVQNIYPPVERFSGGKRRNAILSLEPSSSRVACVPGRKAWPQQAKQWTDLDIAFLYLFFRDAAPIEKLDAEVVSDIHQGGVIRSQIINLNSELSLELSIDHSCPDEAGVCPLDNEEVVRFALDSHLRIRVRKRQIPRRLSVAPVVPDHKPKTCRRVSVDILAPVDRYPSVVLRFSGESIEFAAACYQAWCGDRRLRRRQCQRDVGRGNQVSVLGDHCWDARNRIHTIDTAVPFICDQDAAVRLGRHTKGLTPANGMRRNDTLLSRARVCTKDRRWCASVGKVCKDRCKNGSAGLDVNPERTSERLCAYSNRGLGSKHRMDTDDAALTGEGRDRGAVVRHDDVAVGFDGYAIRIVQEAARSKKGLLSRRRIHTNDGTAPAICGINDKEVAVCFERQAKGVRKVPACGEDVLDSRCRVHANDESCTIRDNNVARGFDNDADRFLEKPARRNDCLSSRGGIDLEDSSISTQGVRIDNQDIARVDGYC